MPKRNASSSLTVHVPMMHEWRESQLFDERAQRLDEGDGAVAPPRAPEGEGEIGLAFALVEREQEAQQVFEARQELAALLVREDEFGHRRVAPVHGAQAIDEMGVGQKS